MLVAVFIGVALAALLVCWLQRSYRLPVMRCILGGTSGYSW